MNAESIRIESDEDGFHLIICTEEEDYFNFRIHNVAEQLHKEALREILPWLVERDEALATYRTDPASPGFQKEAEDLADYYERAVEAWDNRDKTQGGRTF